MELRKKVSEVLSTGAAKTRDVYSRAKARAKGLSAQAMLSLEISQLEREKQRKVNELGSTVFWLFSAQGKSSVTRSTPGVKAVLEELAKLENMVREKQDELKEMKKKGGEG